MPIFDFRACIDCRGFRLDINGLDPAARHHVDIALLPKCCRTDQHPFKAFFARQIIFRQRRAFIGQFVLSGDKRDAAFKLILPQRNRRLRAAMPAAHAT